MLDSDGTGLATDRRSRLISLDPAAIAHNEGLAYSIDLPAETPPGDSVSDPARSLLRLFENGVELLPGHVEHTDVRRLGLGRFSHWGRQLLFSTSDNRSPKMPGRTYQVMLPGEMWADGRRPRRLARNDAATGEDSPRLVVHVGYPKTATTTFQRHVFPHHPEICYLGKSSPANRYVDPQLYGLVDGLVQKSTIEWEGPDRLKEALLRLQDDTDRKCVLLSSESFIHPNAIDIGLVAERLAQAARPCKILITVREQIASVLSWYWTHGRLALYLSIGGKDRGADLTYPFSFEDWVMLERSAPFKSYMSTLQYDKVIAHYESLFGPENVRVLLFEQLGRDQPDYVASLSDWLGVNAETVGRLATSRHENRSQNRATPWQSQDVAQLGDSLRSPKGDAPSRIVMEDFLADLRTSYAAGNARLAERLDLPLARYGYALPAG